MASRMLHLAVAEELMKMIPVKDENRLRLGCILPDAYNPEAPKESSHLKVHVDGDRRTTYDCNRFFSMFEKEIKDDDLYMGYYLHLIQDLVFRELVYDKYKWNPTIPGNVGRLHNDYSLINSYIIKKYGIKNDIHLIENLKKEKLYSLYPFKAEEFLLNMEQDFQNLGKGELFFFTEAMAEEFVTIATEECYKEFVALQNGTQYVDAYKRAWLRANKICENQWGKDVIKKALEYANFEWIPTEKNVKHGVDEAGRFVDTPDITWKGEILECGWWKVNEVNVGIPYSWGNASTLEEFVHGIKVGKYAGNVPEDRSRKGSYHAVGVDCSGLLTVCWGLSEKIATRDIPNIAMVIEGSDEIQQGDVFAKPGSHVMLFKEFVDNEKEEVIIIDATRSTGKVSQRKENVAELVREGYEIYRIKPSLLKY